MPTFSYSPIDLSKDAIRLVRLYKGAFYQDIKCELVETFLSELDGVPYEALSYTWGGDPLEGNAAEILLNGQEASVTENLRDALRCLRLQDRDRMLWVDALCINQADNQEKGHQVGQMRLVYEKAEQVLVWLGPSTDDTDSLMEVMAMLDKKVLEHSDYKKHPLEIWTKEWTDLRIALATLPRYSDHRLLAGLWDLLLRPWFQRVWVLQEVACARVATVVCGTQSVSSRTFAIMPTLLNRPSSTGSHTDEHAKAVLELMPGPMRRESWYSEDRKLATLLQKFQDSRASIPLDRVYALLGISSDAWNFRHFPVDYSITMGALLRNTMSFFLYGKVVRDPRNHGERISAEYAVTEQLPAWNLDGLIDVLEMPGPFWAYVFDWAVGLFEFTLIEGLFATGVFDANIDIRECHVNSITVLAFRVMTDLQGQLLDGTLDGCTYAFLDGLLVGKTLDKRTHAFLDGLSFLPGQHFGIERDDSS